MYPSQEYSLRTLATTDKLPNDAKDGLQQDEGTLERWSAFHSLQHQWSSDVVLGHLLETENHCLS